MRIDITKKQRDTLARTAGRTVWKRDREVILGIVSAFDDATAALVPNVEAIYEAREVYTREGVVEIDEEPAVSSTEDGTWVAAWVWVAGSEDGY